MGRFRAPVSTSELQALSGRNEDGSFRTAVGKEYPPALCQVIAHSFADFAQRAESTPCTEFAGKAEHQVDFTHLVQPFVVALDENQTEFGADFVDGGELPLLKLPAL